jgi:hypothetical protein
VSARMGVLPCRQFMVHHGKIKEQMVKCRMFRVAHAAIFRLTEELEVLCAVGNEIKR